MNQMEAKTLQSVKDACFEGYGTLKGRAVWMTIRAHLPKGLQE